MNMTRVGKFLFVAYVVAVSARGTQASTFPDHQAPGNVFIQATYPVPSLHSDDGDTVCLYTLLLLLTTVPTVVVCGETRSCPCCPQSYFAHERGFHSFVSLEQCSILIDHRVSDIRKFS